jgi:hypothetical protein
MKREAQRRTHQSNCALIWKHRKQIGRRPLGATGDGLRTRFCTSTTNGRGSAVTVPAKGALSVVISNMRRVCRHSGTSPLERYLPITAGRSTPRLRVP